MAQTLPEPITLGRLSVHPVTMPDALEHIMTMVALGEGGYIVTPNVDHVCLAERDDELLRAYDGASLVLTDGQPLVWLSRLIGRPVPAKVSGSDITMPLLRALTDARRSVFFLGATQGVCSALVRRLECELPTLVVTGTASPRFDPCGDDGEFVASLDRAMATNPDVILFALGSPKQEYALVRYVERFRPAVAMGVGATFDFLVGHQRRSPEWMSRSGLEWLFRLAQNPRRLWRRYLVDDRVFAVIAWRAWRARHSLATQTS